MKIDDDLFWVGMFDVPSSKFQIIGSIHLNIFTFHFPLSRVSISLRIAVITPSSNL